MALDSITSTRAKVNVEKARNVLDEYALKEVQFLIDKEGYLRVTGEKGRFGQWPGAVPVIDLPIMEDYDNEDDYWDERREVYAEEADEGFTNLLRELASCIETPLMVLGASFNLDFAFSFACVWRIEPGSNEVQVLHADDGCGDDVEEGEDGIDAHDPRAVQASTT